MMYRFLAPTERSAGINPAVREDASLVKPPTEANGTWAAPSPKSDTIAVSFHDISPSHKHRPHKSFFRRKTEIFVLQTCSTISYPPCSPSHRTPPAQAPQGRSVILTCIVRTVDHGSHRETERDPELGTGGTAASCGSRQGLIPPFHPRVTEHKQPPGSGGVGGGEPAQPALSPGEGANDTDCHPPPPRSRPRLEAAPRVPAPPDPIPVAIRASLPAPGRRMEPDRAIPPSRLDSTPGSPRFDILKLQKKKKKRKEELGARRDIELLRPSCWTSRGQGSLRHVAGGRQRALVAPPRGGGERNLPVPAAPGGDGSGGGGPVVPAGLRSPIPTYTTDRLGHRQRGRLSDRFPLGNNLGRKKIFLSRFFWCRGRGEE